MSGQGQQHGAAADHALGGGGGGRPVPSSPRARVEPLAIADTGMTFSIEGLIESAVEQAIRRSLAPYLRRLSACEPAVYTVAQSAQVLQVSEDTIGRMVRRGVLPRVPHVGGKVLIPKRALDRLIEASEPSQAVPVGAEATDSAGEARSNRSISSAAC
jgi:excisionase family DNA binding protein